MGFLNKYDLKLKKSGLIHLNGNVIFLHNEISVIVEKLLKKCVKAVKVSVSKQGGRCD